MSGALLTNQTAVNTVEDFFIKTGGGSGGGGNIPIVIGGTVERILFPIPDEGAYTIYSFTTPANLLDGNYVVFATYNVDSGGGGDGGTVTCGLQEGPSGQYINNFGSWFDAIRYINITNMMTYEYKASEGDDYPVFNFNIEGGSTSGDGIVYLSYSIIFYPNSSS